MITNEKDHVAARRLIHTLGSVTGFDNRVDLALAALATVRAEERKAVFKEAIEIVDRLVCDPEYDGNWRNGYGHAQNDMQDALEQAAEK